MYTQQTRSERLDALQAHAPQRADYLPRQWRRTLVRIHGRNGRFILPPLAWVLAVSTAWTALIHLRWPSVGRELERLQAAVVIVQSSLAFLIVFRLARAAERYWEARRSAGTMIAMCRVVASTATAALSPEASDKIRRWANAFPVATKNYLRGEGNADELQGLLSEKHIEQVLEAPCPPVVCVDAMRLVVMGWADPQSPLDAHIVSHLMGAFDELTLNFGAMERINNTPLPFVYVAHLRSFLVVFLFAVPLVFARQWGWATPVASTLIAAALLGIEAAAVECERPFARARNHFAFEAFAAVVDTSIHQTAEFFFATAPTNTRE